MTPAPASRPARLLRRLRTEEDGQTLLLGLGLMVVVLALILVVASATSVYLDLKRLTSMADQTAAAAAQSVDEAAYYARGSTGAAGSSGGAVASGSAGAGSALVLSDTGVRAAAVDHLAGEEVSGGLSDLTLTRATAPDGTTAVVTLSAHSQPPFLPWGIVPSDGFTITATGSARGATSQ